MSAVSQENARSLVAGSCLEEELQANWGCPPLKLTVFNLKISHSKTDRSQSKTDISQVPHVRRERRVEGMRAPLF